MCPASPRSARASKHPGAQQRALHLGLGKGVEAAMGASIFRIGPRGAFTIRIGLWGIFCHTYKTDYQRIIFLISELWKQAMEVLRIGRVIWGPGQFGVSCT